MLYLAAFILGCVTRIPIRVSTGIAYGVWAFAIAFEAFSHIQLFNAGDFDRDMVMDRLSALTIIVIGEGINSFIGPLTSGGRAVAFDATALVPLLGAATTPLVLLMLYSQSATWWRLIPPRRTVLAVCSYFCLHLVRMRVALKSHVILRLKLTVYHPPVPEPQVHAHGYANSNRVGQGARCRRWEEPLSASKRCHSRLLPPRDGFASTRRQTAADVR
ncbi:hypothetical protein EXIGLDRAFT_518756 [Exidia glandulosa HHB12029]|uniref:Uncharacterized protein n=1 Tax=Exidia glandulosa HHB12029 TaxID=1314781 RepID=A0A165J6R2_EXIGL|nr:hypothetical protein EXIGLDRAFT_518756 [Exidia glandulosa HHB12029]